MALNLEVYRRRRVRAHKWTRAICRLLADHDGPDLMMRYRRMARRRRKAERAAARIFNKR